MARRRRRPIAGSDIVARSDAILPEVVQCDPEWAGWCAMLVNAYDVSAMGAAPVAALDPHGLELRRVI
ncbi:MAG: hypothetical protein QOK16_971 [Solirubrobacteraceae bacterium]|jgi:selenophosphate synthetase-related protein|nr:hypothetical protein [Solirubrobacteraceae bacterium]